jgi:hypothetical protein
MIGRTIIAMFNRIQVAQRSLALLVGPGLLCVVLGCSGDDGLGTRYSVSGTVTYKGEPVPKARISFIPASKDGAKQGASGEIDNGSYSLSTLTPGDGALPGEYRVTVSAREVDEAKLKADSEKLFAKHGLAKSPMMPPELQAKANAEAKSSIPKKYEDPGTSGLTAKVEEKSNSFKFELTD